MKALVQNSILALLSTALLFSCREDPAPELPPSNYSEGILILNEGTVGANDGEVFHYNPDLDVLTPNLFETANGRPFDGILVDILQVGDRIYLVSSTGKVEIVNASDFTSRGTVADGLDRPSSVAVEGEKLYIADFGPENGNSTSSQAYVAVINGLDGGQVVSKIPVAVLPEIYLSTDLTLVVASQKAGKLQFVNVGSEDIGLSYDQSPTTMVGGVFVAGLGANFYTFDQDVIGLLTTLYPSFVIDSYRDYDLPNATKSFAVLSSFEFALITSSGVSGEKDEVHIVNFNGRSPLTSVQFIEGTNLNGLGYDVSGEGFYLADTKGGIGNGEVRIYKRDGSLVKTLSVGKNPSGFYSKERMR